MGLMVDVRGRYPDVASAVTSVPVVVTETVPPKETVPCIIQRIKTNTIDIMLGAIYQHTFMYYF